MVVSLISLEIPIERLTVSFANNANLEAENMGFPKRLLSCVETRKDYIHLEHNILVPFLRVSKFVLVTNGI